MLENTEKFLATSENPIFRIQLDSILNGMNLPRFIFLVLSVELFKVSQFS